MAGAAALLDTLPPLQRLALGYAPRKSRAALLALFALDARLAAIVRSAREPMLAQLRLAWWREQLLQPAPASVQGEPLVELLRAWPGDRAVLTCLADGWEGLTGEAPLPLACFETLAEARASAFAALAGNAADYAAIERMARNWALADIAARLTHPDERACAWTAASTQDWRREPLPRAMRPLAVLHGLARHGVARGRPVGSISMSSFALALRIGLLGR